MPKIGVSILVASVFGADPMPMSPEQFDAMMREDLAPFGALLHAAGVKAN